MATVTVNAANVGRTKAAIQQRAERAAVMTTLYGPIAKAIKVVPSVVAEEDEVSAFLVIATNRADIQVQVSHPKEIARFTDGDLEEWAILSGDFDAEERAEEWFPADTKPAEIAKRVDALVRELNAAASAEAPKAKPRGIARKAPAVTPEPEVEAKPKRAITRKAKAVEPVEEAPAPKRVRALPSRKK